MCGREYVVGNVDINLIKWERTSSIIILEITLSSIIAHSFLSYLLICPSTKDNRSLQQLVVYYTSLDLKIGFRLLGQHLSLVKTDSSSILKDSKSFF